jgi:hypothetical protein
LSFPLLILTLTGGFIDNETPIASGELISIRHGMPWKTVTVTKTGKLSLLESTNDLAVPDSMLLILIIVFDLYQEWKNFLSGVFDVGYVITQKVKKKEILRGLLDRP